MRILFIGNSYTHYHDMPRILAELAMRAGVPQLIKPELIAPGGATLQSHWEQGDARAALERNSWSAVVLQEQSQRPLTDLPAMETYACHLAALARAGGARLFLYQTWARANQPENQSAITAAYAHVAKVVAATVVPVGTAWQRVLQEKPQLILHDQDMSHPTFAGSYLTAAVFCASIFGVKPVGLAHPPAGIAQEDLFLLHRVAWQVAQEETRA